MHKKLFLFSLILVYIIPMQAYQVYYKVSLDAPQTRYITVELEVLNYKKTEAKLKMPVWTPGSYMVREFSRNVESVIVSDRQGNQIDVRKEDKNTWVVKNGKHTDFIVTYRVYANEVSVRTTFIDNHSAFLSGTSLFMYVQGLEKQPGKVEIQLPKHWDKIATGLHEIPNEPNRFLFKNYDELADCPIQVGSFDTLSFMVMGVPHYVALVGNSNVSKNKLRIDLEKLCLETANVIGKLDFKKYWFFVHHTDQGGGGLEHHNSTAVVMPRWNYTDKVKYENFLSLCVHEYFHAWNVKRIRPIELGPFDYDKEVYTRLLWVAEGITSYYDELIMVRAGFWSKEKLIQELSAKINYNENTPGAKVQSLADASFDAWIKYYRQDENTINSGVSYYTKGALVAALLDLTIIQHSKGRYHLDDLLVYLYDNYYIKQQRGFTEKEFEAAAEFIAGVNLTQFFDALVYQIKPVSYTDFFSPFAVEWTKELSNEPYLGANVAFENGKCVVKSVVSGSNAFQLGLSSKDIILSINGMKPTEPFSQFLGRFETKKEVVLWIERGNQTLSFTTQLMSNPNPVHKLKFKTDASSEELKKQGFWLGAK
jgi:predicted metalloprotease with PDZ domain